MSYCSHFPEEKRPSSGELQKEGNNGEENGWSPVCELRMNKS